MAISRRNFLKGALATMIAAGVVQIPLVEALTVDKKLAAFTELDLMYADMCIHMSLAKFWSGTVIGARHKARVYFKALQLRKQMDLEGVRLLT